MTYDELTDLIQDYLECTETTFVANIPQFIKMAEDDIYRSVQLPDLRKNATASTTASTQYLGTPTDYLSPYSLAVIDGASHYYLQNKDVNFIREVYPAATSEGRPRFYAQWDDGVFLLGPTPDDAYTMELHYFYKPASLADGAGSGTTWLSENAESALLHGCLLHGYLYLKGDQDVIEGYKMAFQKAIADLQVINEGRVRKDTYRISDKKVDV